MQPVISVVIPLYNKERFIGRTIESVLAQSHHNFELIIVDDSSTDRSLSIVKKFYIDKRIKIIKKTNGGVSSARNLGIKSAKYDWVALLDADDQWEPEHLEQILHCIEVCPDAAMIAAHVRQLSTKDLTLQQNRSDLEFTPRYIDYFNSATTDIFTITSSTVCLNRSAALAIGGFDEILAIGEDLDMWARFALRHKVAHTNCTTGIYLRDTGGAIDLASTTSSYTLADFELFNPELIKLKHEINSSTKLDNIKSIKNYINKKALYGVLRALYLDDTRSAKAIARKYLLINDVKSFSFFALTSQPAPIIEKQIVFLKWIRRIINQIRYSK